MNHKISLLCFLFCILSCTQHKPIVIKPFSVLNRVDTFISNGSASISKKEYFLIEDYQDNKRYQDYIDQFILSHKDTNYAKYDQYGIILYKESKRTNLKGNLYDSNVIDKYSDQEDMVWGYEWFGKGPPLKTKYKDGEAVIDADSHIKVLDVNKKYHHHENSEQGNHLQTTIQTI